MKVIYIVKSLLDNRYAFASESKAAEFAELIHGSVDIIPFDPYVSYDGLGGDSNA